MTAIKFDAEQFLQDRQIDRNNVSDALANSQALMGFYGQQAEYWDRHVNDLKLQVRIRENEVGEAARETLGKVTEAALNAKVGIDLEWQTLNKRLNIAREQSGLYSIACKTLNELCQNARSLNAREKHEVSVGLNNGFALTEEDKQSQRNVLRDISKRNAI